MSVTASQRVQSILSAMQDIQEQLHEMPELETNVFACQYLRELDELAHETAEDLAEALP